MDGTPFDVEERWVKDLLLNEDMSALNEGPVCLSVVGK